MEWHALRGQLRVRRIGRGARHEAVPWMAVLLVDGRDRAATALSEHERRGRMLNCPTNYGASHIITTKLPPIMKFGLGLEF